MELSKYEKAKELVEERDDLKKCILALESESFQTSLEPVILYDGWPVDGNRKMIAIPQPVANLLKETLIRMLYGRINSLEQQFKEL